MGDIDAITATLLDYFEGWFDGDAVRMDRALHPELSKRGRGPDGTIHPASKSEMVEATAKGQGKASRPADLGLEVKVTEVYGNIATAIVHSAVYIEYAHLVRSGDGWKILNTVYQRRT